MCTSIENDFKSGKDFEGDMQKEKGDEIFIFYKKVYFGYKMLATTNYYNIWIYNLRIEMGKDISNITRSVKLEFIAKVVVS